MQRQPVLNIPIIRPMKKILTTLTVIAATALGAQGQTTVNFPNSGTYSFTGLTFNSVNVTLTGENRFDTARLLFGVKGLPSGTTITFSGLQLVGDGITSTLSIGGSVGMTSVYNIPAGQEQNIAYYLAPFPPPSGNLNETIQSWSSGNNLASFDISISGPLPEGASLFYATQYSTLLVPTKSTLPSVT